MYYIPRWKTKVKANNNNNNNKNKGTTRERVTFLVIFIRKNKSHINHMKYS